MKNNKTTISIEHCNTEFVDLDITEISPKVINCEIKEGDIVDGYTVGSLLSYSGGESDIRLCKKDNSLYVIKIYRYNNVFFQKHQIIEKIHSPFVMPLLSFGTYKDRPYEIMPYLTNGTIAIFLKSGKKFDDNFIRNIFIPQMNEALHLIHLFGIAHNDIKPDNIYISNDGKNIILGDFGISKTLNGRTSVTNIGGARSKHYSAPESEKYSSPESDYYSFGMTLLDVVLGDFYWKGLSGSDAERDRTRHGIVIPKIIEPSIGDLIYELTRFAPKERATYDTVKLWLDNNNFFSGRREKNTDSQYDFNYSYTIKIDGERKVINSIIDLSVLLNERWDIGIKHFANNLLAESVKSIDQSLYIELNDIYINHYLNNKNVNKGLFLTLREINPNLDFIFKGNNYRNFNGLIQKLEKKYPNYDTEIIDADILCTILMNENNDSSIIEFVRMLQKQCPNTDYFCDMLLNIFSTNNSFFVNGKCISDIDIFLSNINNEKQNLDYLKKGEELFVSIISFENNNIDYIVKIKKLVSSLYAALVKSLHQSNNQTLKKCDEETPKEKFEKYLSAAESGDAESQYNIAICYELGHGVKKNFNSALEWYLESANQNYPDAELRLGEIYSMGELKVKKNQVKAFEYFQLAEKHGNLVAKRMVAISYIAGIKGLLKRTSKNIKEGIKNLSELGKNGDTIAARFLGRFYNLYEKEEYRDSIKSFEWYLVAAEQGDAEAQCQIGLFYMTGYGTLKNVDKAIKWYEKSIEQDHHFSAVSLGKLYLELKMIDKSIYCFEKALKSIPQVPSDHFIELLTLGFIYEKGLGIKKDYEKSRYYYSEAAKITSPYVFDSRLQELKEEFK